MNTKTPLVSVIIPVYNVEKYLRQCIESVLKQTYRKIECICVDDGSTDGSSNILDEYAKKDERMVVVHQNNGGVSAARNKALSLARGEYITFLDSDDMFFETFIFDAIDAFDKDANLELWIGQVIKVDGDGKPFEVQPNKSLPCCTNTPLKTFRTMPGRQYLFSLYPKVYKSNLIKRHNLLFNEGMQNGEDSLFISKVFFFARKAMIADNVVHRRRMCPNSLIQRSWASQVENSLSAIADMKYFLKDKPSNSELRLIAAQWALARIRILFDRGHEYEFLKDYIVSLCGHCLFKNCVCQTIVLWAPLRYRPLALFMMMLPAKVCIALLCLFVRCLMLIRKGCSL